MENGYIVDFLKLIKNLIEEFSNSLSADYVDSINSVNSKFKNYLNSLYSNDLDKISVNDLFDDILFLSNDLDVKINMDLDEFKKYDSISYNNKYSFIKLLTSIINSLDNASNNINYDLKVLSTLKIVFSFFKDGNLVRPLSPAQYNDLIFIIDYFAYEDGESYLAELQYEIAKQNTELINNQTKLFERIKNKFIKHVSKPLENKKIASNNNIIVDKSVVSKILNSAKEVLNYHEWEKYRDSNSAIIKEYVDVIMSLTNKIDKYVNEITNNDFSNIDLLKESILNAKNYIELFEDYILTDYNPLAEYENSIKDDLERFEILEELYNDFMADFSVEDQNLLISISAYSHLPKEQFINYINQIGIGSNINYQVYSRYSPLKEFHEWYEMFKMAETVEDKKDIYKFLISIVSSFDVMTEVYEEVAELTINNDENKNIVLFLYDGDSSTVIDYIEKDNNKYPRDNVFALINKLEKYNMNDLWLESRRIKGNSLERNYRRLSGSDYRITYYQMSGFDANIIPSGKAVYIVTAIGYKHGEKKIYEYAGSTKIINLLNDYKNELLEQIRMISSKYSTLSEKQEAVSNYLITLSNTGKAVISEYIGNEKEVSNAKEF